MARLTLRARHFPYRSRSEWPQAISTSMRWIRYKPTSRSHIHRRRAGDMEHRSREPAAAVRAAGGIVSRSRSRQPTSRSIRRFETRRAHAVSVHAACWCGSRASRSATRSRRGTVVHVGFGVFNDIIPAQIADLAATNAPYAPTFVGGIGGQVGGVAIAPGVPIARPTQTSNANRSFQSPSARRAPCAGIRPGAPTCPLAVSLNTFPTGTLKTPYYYQYNFGIERQTGLARRGPHRLRGHPRPA